MISVSNSKKCNKKNNFHEYLLFINYYFLDEDETDDLNKTYTDLAPVIPEFYNYIDAFDQQNVEQRNGNLLLNNCLFKISCFSYLFFLF